MRQHKQENLTQMPTKQMEGIFNRAERLLGNEAMETIARQHVLLVGVGGVGSWCAESLIRSGIMHLTIVDSDLVSVSNVNRQLMATTLTVGQVKVEVLRKRLLEINPEAHITAIQDIYSSDNSDSFHLDQYDYIIDCIDSLKDKITLLVEATRQPRATVLSSMGAALKLDPTRIQVAEFWKVRGCPLGSAMRKRMRQRKQWLSKNVQCVFSDELLENKGPVHDETMPQATLPAGKEHLEGHDWNASKAQINGSLPHITAIFGFTLAGLVVQHICTKR